MAAIIETAPLWGPALLLAMIWPTAMLWRARFEKMRLFFGHVGTMSLIVTHRGSVNAWECDENAHLNVRFFIAKAHEGVPFILNNAGLADAPYVLVSEHLRFHREARIAVPLVIYGGISSQNGDQLVLYSEVRHGGTDAVLATLVHHLSVPGSRATTMDESECVAIPQDALPRGLTGSPPELIAADRLAERGYVEVGRGRICNRECDHSGQMERFVVAGRISDAVVNLMAQHQSVAELSKRSDGTEGGAVVEYRLHYDQLLRSGDGYSIHSGVRAVGNKTQHLEHRMVNAATGASVARGEVIAVALDLNTRRAVPLSEDRRARMMARLVRGPP